MAEDPAAENEAERARRIPPIPMVTRTETAVWVIYALVAVLVVAIPVATRSISLPDAGAVLLLLGAAAMSFRWYRNGELRTAEWMPEAEYEEFLKELQGPYEPPRDPDD
ncbi:MAG TPA: hypothetical protein VMV23_00760 [Candidatus Nanopelagicaceae bacterium]|nr:hypothetical protein [Candidatus Nanopelagicaceae bacterium]